MMMMIQRCWRKTLPITFSQQVSDQALTLTHMNMCPSVCEHVLWAVIATRGHWADCGESPSHRCPDSVYAEPPLPHLSGSVEVLKHSYKRQLDTDGYSALCGVGVGGKRDTILPTHPALPVHSRGLIPEPPRPASWSLQTWPLTLSSRRTKRILRSIKMAQLRFLGRHHHIFTKSHGRWWSWNIWGLSVTANPFFFFTGNPFLSGLSVWKGQRLMARLTLVVTTSLLQLRRRAISACKHKIMDRIKPRIFYSL